MIGRRFVALHMVFLTALLPLLGCGGQNPASPSAPERGVVLRGVVLGAEAGVRSGDVSAQSTSADRITVTLQENTSITTTVSVNGTFELKGLPTGSFTLVFSNGTGVIGTVPVSGATVEIEVKIVVQVTVTTVIVIKIEGAEIEHEPNHDNDND